MKKIIVLLISSFFLYSCGIIELIQGFNYMTTFQPVTRTYNEHDIFQYIYGILENGNVERKKLSKNDIHSMNKKVYELYGIVFERGNRIKAPNKLVGKEKEYNIIFYTDFILKVNEKKYIIPKDQILLKEDMYEGAVHYKYILPFDSNLKNVEEVIFDIGEIEIIDKDKKIIRKKQKVPPLLFKRVRYRKRILDWQGNTKTYYEGWAENYHEYDESKEKEIEENQDKKEK